MTAQDETDWQNFDKVTEILESFAEKSKDTQKLKDANEALGQLLGVTEKDVFRNMSSAQQNAFLQSVMNEYSSHGLSPADMAQKLLEGLQLRTPTYAPSTPAPAFGLRGPGMESAPMGPGGMGGGTSQFPPQQPWQMPPASNDDSNNQN